MLRLLEVSAFASVSEIAEAIRAAGATSGALRVTNLPQPPFTASEDNQSCFDSLFGAFASSPDLAARVNSAYTRNLVYKDAFGAGNGGPTVDRKRVLDLSPERLAAILEAEPELAPELGEILASPLAWWHRLDAEVKPRLLEGLALAIGDDAVLADAASNWRMVDYYSLPPQPSVPSAPRCGEHRDFGSMTLVFSDRPGLEIFMDGEWRPIEQPEEGAGSTSAILLFGWCTEIRSNGRIRAALHRVDASLSERRLSAVLFVAPKCAQTPLEPVLLGKEERVYISGIKVGQLRGDMSRKWRWREGTLSPQDRLLEEHEIRVEKIVSQDDVIRRTAVASR